MKPLLLGAGPEAPAEEHLLDDGDRLRVGWVPREQKMLKGHLPRVIYHQVY